MSNVDWNAYPTCRALPTNKQLMVILPGLFLLVMFFGWLVEILVPVA